MVMEGDVSGLQEVVLVYRVGFIGEVLLLKLNIYVLTKFRVKILYINAAISIKF